MAGPEGRDRLNTGSDLPVDKIDSVETAATGTNYAALPSHPRARMVRFMNPSTDLTVRRVSETNTVTIKASQETPLYVASNSDELEVRRADSSNTQITVELLVGVY
jgi:hypothetical protein